LVTLIATPLAVVWGGFVGIYLGLVGGKLDDVLMRLVDAFLALPWILKMLLMIATFGTGLGVLIPTLAFFLRHPGYSNCAGSGPQRGGARLRVGRSSSRPRQTFHHRPRVVAQRSGRAIG